MSELKLGDEVTGVMRGLQWRGTVVRFARRVRDEQIMALVELAHPITTPGVETKELILPLDYVSPGEEREAGPCLTCGIWICVTCYNFRRNYARRDRTQICGNCGYNKGEWRSITHRDSAYHG